MQIQLAFILACLLIAAIYLTLILLYGIGLWRLKKPSSALQHLQTKVTVIIPARNEEANIGNCLEDLYWQEYPVDLLEILIADDASEDRTKGIILDFLGKNTGLPLRIIDARWDDPGPGSKKKAIEKAVAHASGDLILMTDADTRFGAGWIKSVVSYYEQFHPKMIIGPVAFLQEKSLFARLQTLEFLGLMGATAGACGTGHPVMCNGANLAFERSAFHEINGYRSDEKYVSGDDIFLMMKIRKRFGKDAVQFLKSENGIVRTGAKGSFREFCSQRLRWVSKSKGYNGSTVLFVAIIAYLFNFSLLAGFVAGFFFQSFFFLAMILLILKMIAEFPLVYSMALFFDKRKLLGYYPLVQVLNIIYVVLAGFLGQFLPFEWKGRKISPRHGFDSSVLPR